MIEFSNGTESLGVKSLWPAVVVGPKDSSDETPKAKRQKTEWK